MSAGQTAEDLLRELAPQVLGVLMRRYGGLDSCEDAVQEALLDAAVQWPASGRPENPRAWLLWDPLESTCRHASLSIL